MISICQITLNGICLTVNTTIIPHTLYSYWVTFYLRPSDYLEWYLFNS